MPSKKGSTAYRARNARRQADTWINNLLNIAKSSKHTLNERAAARQMANTFRDLKQQTYRPKGKATRTTDNIITQATERIKSLAGSARISKGGSGASNLLAQQQINLASRRYERHEDNPSMYTQEEVKAFYRATQNWWEGSTRTVGGYDTGTVDTSKINQTVMKKLGTTSLSEAFEFITQREGVQRAITGYQVSTGRLSESNMTAEQLEMYEQLMQGDTLDSAQGSPTYLQEVEMLGNDTESIAQIRAEFREWKRNQVQEE